MKRRDFITLPRPSATAWPRAVDHAAAEALGLDMPSLACADEVIE
jgi:hypothetical protein